VKRRTKIGLGIIALICGFSLWYTFREDYGVGVKSVGWLPAEAHDITYFKNGWTALAEFDVEQEAFERWCADRKWPLRELGDREHQMISRSLWMLEQRGILPATAEPNAGGEDSYRRQRSIKSFGGGDLFYEERGSNGGGYSVGYNVKQKRGYYSFNHH